MLRILLTRRLFPESEALLRRSFRLTRVPRLAAGVVSQLTDVVDGAFMDRFPRLRVISQCAVGVDNIDLAAARSRGIAIMNTPGVLTQATADMTWALILAVARRLPEADRVCRDGAFAGWDLEFMLGRDLAGGTLGIVGAGRIGAAVASRAAAFGMRVLIHTRGGPPAGPAWRGARPVSLASLLSRSDVVSLHVPATPATHHLIGDRELGRMKRGAILINTSRGTIVDERALVAALKKRRIWGAGLDVFAREPRIPRALRALDNVVLTPHIASATRGTRGAMATLAAANLVEYFAGRPDAGRLIEPGVRNPGRRERRPAAGPA